MGLGRKIGRSFIKMAETGKRIDRGLDDLLGDDRTKPGQGFSKERTAKKTADITRKERGKSKDKLSLRDTSERSPDFFKSDKNKDDEKGDDMDIW